MVRADTKRASRRFEGGGPALIGMGLSFPPSEVRVLGSAGATAICSERNCSGVLLAGPESRPHSLEIALPNLVEARIVPSASYGLVYCSKGVGLTGPRHSCITKQTNCCGARGTIYRNFETRSASWRMTLAASLPAVPVGSPMYMILGLDQCGMRGHPPQPSL